MGKTNYHAFKKPFSFFGNYKKSDWALTTKEKKNLFKQLFFSKKMQINRPMYYYYYYYVDQVKALGRKFRLDKIRNDGYASILETPTEMFEELDIDCAGI